MIHFIIKDAKGDIPVREGAYGLLIQKDRLAVVRTPRGYFLPGGGVEEGESHEACIIREFEEEVGLSVEVQAFFAKEILRDITPSRDHPIDMVANCYKVRLIGTNNKCIEEDHHLEWMPLNEARCRLKLVHQGWIIEQLLQEKAALTLSPYNPHWPTWFKQIRQILRKAVGKEVASIEHVGSTSVPEIMAKPVIDIDIVLRGSCEFECLMHKLSSIGYKHVGDQGIKDREVFKRKEIYLEEGPLDVLPHHLYVCPDNSEELQRHLYFRDRLRHEAELRRRYNAIKKEIIDTVGETDRSGYVEAKATKYNKFFREVLEGIDN